MSKYREEYMQSLTEQVKQINSKTELTEQDKFIILMYKKELNRYEYVSPFNKIFGYSKQILSLWNEKPQENVSHETNEIKGDEQDGI